MDNLNFSVGPKGVPPSSPPPVPRKSTDKIPIQEQIDQLSHNIAFANPMTSVVKDKYLGAVRKLISTLNESESKNEVVNKQLNELRVLANKIREAPQAIITTPKITSEIISEAEIPQVRQRSGPPAGSAKPPIPPPPSFEGLDVSDLQPPPIKDDPFLKGMNKEMATKLHTLRAQSEKNPTASIAVGDIYMQGRVGVPKDEKKGFEYYLKAANLGDPIGIYRVAECLEEGRGVSKHDITHSKKYSFDKAFKELKKAAPKDPEAAHLLGQCYALGRGVKRNETEAIKQWEGAAKQKNGDALNSLADIYQGRQRVASSMFRNNASEGGHTGAKILLGQNLLYGRGQTKDEKGAYKLFKEAAEKGDIDGLLWMARCLYEAKGVEKNVPLAKHYVEEVSYLIDKDDPSSTGLLLKRLKQELR